MSSLWDCFFSLYRNNFSLDLIERVRNLSLNLEMTVSGKNLEILRDGRNLVNGINQVDFTEEIRNALGGLESAKQTVLFSGIAWNESTGIFRAANNTLSDAQFFLEMLEEIVISVDIMNKTLAGVRERTITTNSLNFHAEVGKK